MRGYGDGERSPPKPGLAPMIPAAWVSPLDNGKSIFSGPIDQPSMRPPRWPGPKCIDIRIDGEIGTSVDCSQTGATLKGGLWKVQNRYILVQPGRKRVGRGAVKGRSVLKKGCQHFENQHQSLEYISSTPEKKWGAPSATGWGVPFILLEGGRGEMPLPCQPEIAELSGRQIRIRRGSAFRGAYWIVHTGNGSIYFDHSTGLGFSLVPSMREGLGCASYFLRSGVRDGCTTSERISLESDFLPQQQRPLRKAVDQACFRDPLFKSACDGYDDKKDVTVTTFLFVKVVDRRSCGTVLLTGFHIWYMVSYSLGTESFSTNPTTQQLSDYDIILQDCTAPEW
ncbi:hypothetical protein B0H11DRAFT_1929496 [Mycena galericulata]|nr:hypothetical protein B0H11DRAFT_1929496 [Mycena galericulata]